MLARLFALILFCPSLALAAGFVSTYEDLPLPTALTEVAGSAYSFDSQDGRIMEAEAKGLTDKAAVLGFYQSALPQLGWVQDGPALFHRDQDVLRLDFAEAGKSMLIVKFKVTPK